MIKLNKLMSIGFHIGVISVIVLLTVSDAFCWKIAPFTTAPPEKIGGSIIGEYDMRQIDGVDVIVRRPEFRLDYRASDRIAVWGEAGIASLHFTGGTKPLEGAFGAAFGLGMTITSSKPTFRGWEPFGTLRWTIFGSKLTDDNYTMTSQRESKFTWNEGAGYLGVYKALTWGEFFCGGAIHYLDQSEHRTLTSGRGSTNDAIAFQSGIKPGGVVGALFPLSSKIVISLTGEGYSDGGRVTIGFGQWGG